MSRLVWCCAVILLLTAPGGRGSQTGFRPTHLELPPPQQRWMNQLPQFGHSKEHNKHMQRLPLLRVTSVKNCGTDHDPIQLKTLALPNVINLKSSFNFSIDAALDQQIKAPLKVSLKVQRHFLLWWVTVPCIEGVFGTCSFSDLCSLLPGRENSTCPPVFTEHDLPCGCPAGPGEYKAEDVPVDLASVNIPEELVSGSYHLRATLEDGGSGLLLGCFDFYIKLE